MRRSLFQGVVTSTSLTTKIIFFNVAVFLLVSILASFYPGIENYLALNPSLILQGKNLWTLVTHMFMHANFFHLFFNMLSLFFIGGFLEQVIGRKRFFWLYITSGILAGLCFVVLAGLFGGYDLGARLFGSSTTLAVGASGAIFGVAGVLSALIPRKKVYFIAGPLIAIIIEAILNTFLQQSIMAIISLLINLYIILSIFMLFSFSSSKKFILPIEIPFWFLPIIAIIPLFVIGYFIELPIGNSAHLGGFLVGLIYGLYLRNKYKNKVKLLNKRIR